MDPRLARLLGGAELAPLRQRLRRHFERRDDGASSDSLQLTRLSPQEHAALAQLTGRPARSARSTRLDVPSLDAALQAVGIAASLRDALEQLDGPISGRALQRAAVAARWAEVLAAPSPHPLMGCWWQQPQVLTLLKRLSRQDAEQAHRLLLSAEAVLQRLPAQGIPRSQLAAEVLGNAHGLDNGQALASLVLAAWRHAQPPTPTEPEIEPDSQPTPEEETERSRDTWARAGVLVNELARPALVLNLPNIGTAGEPTYLSLRQLLRRPTAWRVAGQRVFVCENPNLLAIAADQLGPVCATLVCTEGMPAAAQRTLLQQLSQAGARLHCHADFDWAGMRIARHLLQIPGTSPWRLQATDYEAAIAAPRHVPHRLAGVPAHTPWHPPLAAAMQRHGVAVAEEALASALLQDLRPG